MSVQPSQQQLSYKCNLWIDSRTHASDMGRSFKMIEESGRFANMTALTIALDKNNVPTRSGLTCCINKSNGFKFLLELYEAPYLENNEGLLLLTNQYWEAAIWMADVLCHHGGE
eukprot:12741894-Ditylum_brightwellii.AAC.1